MQTALFGTRVAGPVVRAARAGRVSVKVQAAQKLVNVGVIGTKAGMTTYFLPNGDAIPCTVIALEDGNVVSQVCNG